MVKDVDLTDLANNLSILHGRIISWETAQRKDRFEYTMQQAIQGVQL
jgi:hypothetical protein